MSAIQEQIQKRAYDFYCKRGCIDGHGQEDWLRAEKEIHMEVIKAPNKRSEAFIIGPSDELGLLMPDKKRRRTGQHTEMVSSR